MTSHVHRLVKAELGCDSVSVPQHPQGERPGGISKCKRGRLLCCLWNVNVFREPRRLVVPLNPHRGPDKG